MYGLNQDHLDKIGTPELKSFLKPIELDIKKLRSVNSSFAFKNKENKAEPNLPQKEFAFLPDSTDCLYASFSVIFNDLWKKPTSSNSFEYVKLITEFAKNYKDKFGLKTLASLYATQIMNGSWFFRNLNLGECKVYVSTKTKFNLTYDELVDVIELGLGEKGGQSIKVEGVILTEESQNVFPSQLFTNEVDKNDPNYNDKKGTKLAHINKQVIIADQKIGNALRTIDTWYEKDTDYKIAINPYGVDPSFGHAFRNNKNDLYDFICDIAAFTEKMKNDEVGDDYHFVIACLILGGVYSGEGKPKKDKMEKEVE